MVQRESQESGQHTVAKFNMKKIKEVALAVVSLVFTLVLLHVSILYQEPNPEMIRQKWIYCFIGDAVFLFDVLVMYIMIRRNKDKERKDGSDKRFGAKMLLVTTLVLMLYFAAGYIYFKYFVDYAESDIFFGRATVLACIDLIVVYKLKKGTL